MEIINLIKYEYQYFYYTNNLFDYHITILIFHILKL